jgi:hypothetical protein
MTFRMEANGSWGREAMAASKKGKSRKEVIGQVWSDKSEWNVVAGRLVPGAGRPRQSLFRYVGEKLPWGSLAKVRAHVVRVEGDDPEGIYLAHDSMGFARYGGRGQIFGRLRSHRRKYPRELLYYSFYVVASKVHERELETVILRAAGPQMILNERKVRSDISSGNIKDYEPGTRFFERHAKKGKKRRRVWRKARKA